MNLEYVDICCGLASGDEAKGKIVSQVELNIPTYNKDNLPKELLSIEAIKPGSRNL